MTSYGKRLNEERAGLWCPRLDGVQWKQVEAGKGHGLFEGAFGKTACLLLGEQVEDSILIAGSVNVAFFILADGADGYGGAGEQRTLPGRPVSLGRLRVELFHAVDFADTEVGKDEVTLQVWDSISAVDGAPNDGAAPCVIVFGHRECQTFCVADDRFMPEALVALHDGPAVVFAAAALCGLEVHLFPQGIPRIRKEEVTRQMVESESPWVAQAQRPDLRAVCFHCG